VITRSAWPAWPGAGSFFGSGLDNVGAEGRPVDDRGDEAGIVDYLAPFRERQVRRDKAERCEVAVVGCGAGGIASVAVHADPVDVVAPGCPSGTESAAGTCPGWLRPQSCAGPVPSPD